MLLYWPHKYVVPETLDQRNPQNIEKIWLFGDKTFCHLDSSYVSYVALLSCPDLAKCALELDEEKMIKLIGEQMNITIHLEKWPSPQVWSFYPANSEERIKNASQKR